jgi:hypothetical protein
MDSATTDGANVPVQQRIEPIAKVVAATLAAFYAIGLIITNMFLGSLGASDFSDLRPRTILVGMAFAIYVAVPLGLAVVPLYVFAFVRRHTMHRFAATAAAVAMAVGFAFLLPAPFEFFIVATGRHGGFTTLSTRFWREAYQDSSQWPYILVLILLPMAGLAVASIRQRILSPDVKKGAYVLALLGVVSQMIAFADSVYPELQSSIGGGHPELVELVFQKAGADTSVRRIPDGYYLLWHIADDTLVLTGATEGPVSHSYFVRRSDVATMIRTPAHVRLRDSAVQHIIAHSEWGACETKLTLPPPPGSMLDTAQAPIAFATDSLKFSIIALDNGRVIVVFPNVAMTNTTTMRGSFRLLLVVGVQGRETIGMHPQQQAREELARSQQVQQTPLHDVIPIEPQSSIHGSLIFEVSVTPESVGATPQDFGATLIGKAPLAFHLTETTTKRAWWISLPGKEDSWKSRDTTVLRPRIM